MSGHNGIPRLGTVRAVRLPADTQARFDRAAAAEGETKLAARLGVTSGLVCKLRHGGHAAPDAVARVVAAMGAA